MLGNESAHDHPTDDFQLLDLSNFCAVEGLVGAAENRTLGEPCHRAFLSPAAETKTQTYFADQHRPEGKRMKKLFSLPFGSKGSASLKIEDGCLVIDATYQDRGFVKGQAGYPIADLLVPVKTKFIDGLKEKIPGDLDDKILDGLWEKALKEISE